MAVTAAIATVASVGVSTHSALEQRQDAKRSERVQKKANKIQQAKASVERSLARKQAVSRARIAQQSNIAGAVNQGVSSGSSALQGSQAALGSNLATSVASSNRAFTSGQQTFDLRQQSSFIQQNSQANAAILGAVSGGLQAGASFAASAAPTTPSGSPQAPAMIAKPTAGTSFTPQSTFLSPYGF